MITGFHSRALVELTEIKNGSGSRGYFIFGRILRCGED